MEPRIKHLVDILKGHRVLIQTHNCPDPDAMASAFGLQFLLERFGIKSVLVYDGVISKISDFTSATIRPEMLCTRQLLLLIFMSIRLACFLSTQE